MSRIPARVPQGAAAAPRDAGALAHWLLAGPAQCIAGPHAGAVAGSIDAEGNARYVYPEITGYFLHWLAWQAACHGRDAALARRAAAAQAWLRRWLASSTPPPTRVHLDGTRDDWRNDALFCFDVAMVLRGLAAAVRRGVLEPDPEVIAGLCAQLRALIGSDGMFVACAVRPDADAPPARWSTRRGGFLAKATAGVLAAADDLPGIGADIVAAAHASHADALRAAETAPHAEVHPLLYTFEGILSLPGHPRFAAMLPCMGEQFDALLARVRELGHVPETLAANDTGTARTDVLAQALRVGHFLERHRPGRPPDAVGLARLRHALAARIDGDGAVPFAASPPPQPRNVWAAMFAEQALGLSTLDRDPPAAADDGRLLV